MPYLLYRVATFRFPPQKHLSVGALPTTRFLPLSRHHEEASTIREGSQGLTTFRPQVFSTSRRLTPLLRFAGLFHPAATCTVLPFRGFSLRVVPLPQQKPLPPCRSKQRALTNRNSSPRSRPPTSRLSPTRSSVVTGWYYPCCNSLPSSGYCPLQVALSLRFGPRLTRGHPLMTLSNRIFKLVLSDRL